MYNLAKKLSYEESQDIEEDSQEILSDPLNTDVTTEPKYIKMYKIESGEKVVQRMERYKKQASKMSLSYTKVVIPTNMRSRYWKYFGFPADDNGDIVTKDQIVCTLCNVPITFHKNTTNLRSHLQRHHKDAEFDDDGDDDNDDDGNKITLAKKPRILNHYNKLKRIKIGRISLKPTDVKKLQISQTVTNPLIETITNESDLLDSGQITADTIEYQDYTGQAQDSEMMSDIKSSAMITSPPPSANVSVAPIEINLTELIQQMIITDLFPTSVTEGEGFKNLIWTLCGNTQIPKKKEIEDSIAKVYEEKSTKLLQILQKHSRLYRFSLGIEIWQNTEKKNFITIYVNYIPNDKPTTFLNVLFTTVELTKYTNFDEVFNGINLRNCSAAVINSYNNIIASFLATYDIPCVNCFDTVVQRCMKLVFNLPEINSMFSEINDIFYKNAEVFTDPSILPRVDDLYPWTKYNLLKYFNDNVTFQDDNNDLMLKVKMILECLQSLKITVETLIDEPNAVSSLTKPLASKLVDQYFQPCNGDYELAGRIKDIIGKELKHSLLSNDFLIISSFLDPRFHSFVNEYEMDTVYQTLNKKITQIQDYHINVGSNNNNSSNSSLKSEIIDTPKRSSLKLFFDDSQRAQACQPSRATIEQEINKYRTEVFTDLEQCPLDWWSKMGYVYGQLKLVADQYKCVPCCINNNFKKTVEEQIDFNNRRLMLRGSTINQLLFLYYNKKFFH